MGVYFRCRGCGCPAIEAKTGCGWLVSHSETWCSFWAWCIHLIGYKLTCVVCKDKLIVPPQRSNNYIDYKCMYQKYVTSAYLQSFAVWSSNVSGNMYSILLTSFRELVRWCLKIIYMWCQCNCHLCRRFKVILCSERNSNVCIFLFP